MEKRHSRTVMVGGVPVGGGHPVTVQSMLNAPAADTEGNVRQAVRLEQAGCEILRVAVPTRQSVALIPALKQAVRIPIVADIHFDYRIALDCVAAGADKIRINPGNIGEEQRIRQVAVACRDKRIPIRIGVNAGSLEKDVLRKYGAPCPQALRDSALFHAALLEKYDFTDIVLSMKSSRVDTMVQAYRLTAQACDYPLHLGVTEAGSERMGLIKSAAGIGALLLDGIGDTIRVSLTADTVREVEAGADILRAVGLRHDRVNVISCPTCGRTAIPLLDMVSQVEQRVAGIRKPLTVAVMGCAVNGPGEAAQADLGIAGGAGKAVLFRHGEVLRTVAQEDAVDELMKELEKL
ncbi:MAG: flavodoxin-dependent (E)-4-hydroxy-3-methylbut-2-enyl-diphosphate synthase [Clostridia bacterium]|nr:flavodoxin-dependent (E)-4-hydroxy-3-methylbut-2-enyl-diphosphate synthase [Clostridia bacterium]